MGERPPLESRRKKGKAGYRLTWRVYGKHRAAIRRPLARARYRDASGREHARHFDCRVDGQRWLDGVTTAVQTGVYVDPSKARVTVAEWAPTWLAAQGQLKPSTRARYDGIMRVQVLPRWGRVALCDVTHADVASW